jgi:hypothetical protein
MAKRAKKPDGLLSLSVNGHTVTGEKRDGKWTFHCDSWPALAGKYNGAETTSEILGEFMTRCLAGSITVKQLAEHLS